VQIYFQSEEVKAAIVTCGGLCPGINTVIREIVCCLWRQYNVREIVGIEVCDILQLNAGNLFVPTKVPMCKHLVHRQLGILL
jgi:hypothetical protein